MKKLPTFLLATASLSAFLSGCLIPTPDLGGACITHDLDDDGWWCDDEDESEEYCNDSWAAEMEAYGIYNDYEFYAGLTCDDLGYSYWCTSDDMAASGSSVAYLEPRYLSNPECNPQIP